MYRPSTALQGAQHPAFRADGSLTAATKQLILPRATSRAHLLIQNTTAAETIQVDHGSARATATITNGQVSGFTVLNGGFGFTLPPIVTLKGGGGNGIFLAALAGSAWDGRGQIDNWPVPAGYNTLATPPIVNRPATAHAVLTSGVVTSIVIDDPGAGYVNAPEVEILNHPNDPFGCADPTSSGLQLASGVIYRLDGTFCHTDPIALYCSANATFYLEYAP